MLERIIMKTSEALNTHISQLSNKLETKFEILKITHHVKRESANLVSASINVTTRKGTMNFSSKSNDLYTAFSDTFQKATRELRKCKNCKRKKFSMSSEFWTDDFLPAA